MAGTGSLRFLASGDPGAQLRRGRDADLAGDRPDASGPAARRATFLALPPAKGLPRDKPWLKVSEATRPPSAASCSRWPSSCGPRSTPAQSLGLLLAAGQVDEVGHGTVEGVPTTEHRAVVDLRQAVQLADDPASGRSTARCSPRGSGPWSTSSGWTTAGCRAVTPTSRPDHGSLLGDRRLPALGRPVQIVGADGQAGLRRRRPQELSHRRRLIWLRSRVAGPTYSRRCHRPPVAVPARGWPKAPQQRAARVGAARPARRLVPSPTATPRRACDGAFVLSGDTGARDGRRASHSWRGLTRRPRSPS